MKAGKLFTKTLPFCWAKLLLGGAMVLILGIILALCLGIGYLFGDEGIVVGFLIWCGAVGVVRFAVMHYLGYMVKAGHISVIAEAAVTGEVPANQVKYGIGNVKERFVTANVFFAVDKLVSGAVKQIQRGIGKVADFLDFIPGMDKVADLAKFFVELSLGYVDECCLGYTFYKKEQGAFESACDGVVVYAQNIKKLLGNAAKTMLKVILAVILTVIVIFIPIGLLFRVFDWSGLLAFLISCLLTWVVKFAFLDSFILCQTMAGYMEAAQTTEITFDLYEKLCGLSGKFKELFNKGKEENPEMAYAGAAAAAAPAFEYVQPQTVTTSPPPAPTANAERPVFCGQCGTKNAPTAAFCTSCGAKLK